MKKAICRDCDTCELVDFYGDFKTVEEAQKLVNSTFIRVISIEEDDRAKTKEKNVEIKVISEDEKMKTLWKKTNKYFNSENS